MEARSLNTRTFKPAAAMKTLLIVDDEKDNRDALQDVFADDYHVHLAKNGEEALNLVREVNPDLILLDIIMPRVDGFQTCLRLKQNEDTQNIPVIFLTTKSEPETETFGLELGAEDFVRKPFNREVLKARVHRRLQSGQAQAAAPGETTEIGECVIHWDRQEAQIGGRSIPLTTKESALLRLFVENKGRLLSRNVILERIWPDTYITDRTIDSHVKEVRKKIPGLAQMLKTVYGSGYRLDLEG